jgi:hypothetical protein
MQALVIDSILIDGLCDDHSTKEGRKKDHDDVKRWQKRERKAGKTQEKQPRGGGQGDANYHF